MFACLQTYLVTVRDQMVFVDERRFKAHTNYTVRVRTQPNQEYYRGVWSEWSPPLYWSSGDTFSFNYQLTCFS